MSPIEPGDPVAYSGTRIRGADWSKDLPKVRRLFRDYRSWLADHSDPAAARTRARAGLAQVDRLIAELPGAYGPPGGDVLLAYAKGAVVACGALRGLDPRIAEIKRVYVRADHRGPGFGPILTRALLDRARALGYTRVRVDTLPTMAAAQQFYPAMGFRPIPAYWPHPVTNAVFFEYRLGSSSRPTRRARRPAAPKGR
jgi:putative acetyltransferase